MKNLLLAFSLVIAFSGCASTVPPESSGVHHQKYVLSHVHIRLNSAMTSKEQAERVAKRAGLTFADGNEKFNLFRLKTQAKNMEELEQIKARLMEDPCVKVVLFDFQVYESH